MVGEKACGAGMPSVEPMELAVKVPRNIKPHGESLFTSPLSHYSF